MKHPKVTELENKATHKITVYSFVSANRINAVFGTKEEMEELAKATNPKCNAKVVTE